MSSVDPSSITMIFAASAPALVEPDDQRSDMDGASFMAGMTTDVRAQSGRVVHRRCHAAGQVAKRKLMMSPSWTMYSLPSRRTSPCSRQAAIDPRAISAS